MEPLGGKPLPTTTTTSSQYSIQYEDGDGKGQVGRGLLVSFKEKRGDWHRLIRRESGVLNVLTKLQKAHFYELLLADAKFSEQEL